MTAYGTALTNGYRGDGLRGWKQGTGSKTYFLYDGEQVIGEYNSSGTYANLYTFGANGLVSQRNVAAGATNFYTFDLQGNIAETLHADQTQNGAWRFDAYGGTGTAGPFVAGAPYANFGGQWGYYSDSETGLELLTHRFYDRGAGRFVTRDPFGYDGGIDLYTYTANNPVNESDDSGFGGKPPSKSGRNPSSPPIIIGHPTVCDDDCDNPVYRRFLQTHPNIHNEWEFDEELDKWYANCKNLGTVMSTLSGIGAGLLTPPIVNRLGPGACAGAGMSVTWSSDCDKIKFRLKEIAHKCFADNCSSSAK